MCELSERQKIELEEVLGQYPLVFRELNGLPPVRQINYSITLLSVAGPVSVRPYRYPHYHKDEIERQVGLMLYQGVIRDSVSSFSCPVILVKKKDNTWHMCIDYRALNKVTVPDKYLIPVVDELIDELNGAVFFF